MIQEFYEKQISFITNHTSIKSDNDFFELIKNTKFENSSFPNKDAIEFVKDFQTLYC